MKILITTFLALGLLGTITTHAQNKDPEEKLELLKRSKEEVVSTEKELLKKEVERINLQLENDAIDSDEAERLKKEAAEKHALNIENKLAIINNRMALIERNGDTDDEGVEIKITFDNLFSDFNSHDNDLPDDRRTTSEFVFAVGFNNVIIDGQTLDDSPYKTAGSRFAELGVAWKTRVFENSNWLRLKYGFSFQFNGLKPTENRYFVDTGAETELQTYPIDLDKSKFRMDNLVVPVHFEFGPSKKIQKDTYFRYETYDFIKVGVGGYAGVNLRTIQKLKFSENGEDVKQKLKGSYNTNNFIYGISGYIGWRGMAVYAKYDLNTIFKDNPVEQRNVSLGLRFDMD
ncbi:MAG: hypothetical protein HKM28_02400 [Flavobacteriaceae bacterium]|nr:hypothetical protein [Flavobacteriaceae bacterium]